MVAIGQGMGEVVRPDLENAKQLSQSSRTAKRMPQSYPSYPIQACVFLL